MPGDGKAGEHDPVNGRRNAKQCGYARPIVALTGVVLCLFGLFLTFTAEAASRVKLTSEENTWLGKNPGKLVLFFNVEFPPIEFRSEAGTFTGMGADIIAQVEKLLNVTFIKKPSDDWNAHLSALETGECAIAPTIVKTPEREEYAIFTTPYATVPVVIIATNATSEKRALGDFARRRLGVVSGYATEKYLRDQALLSHFEVVPVKNVLEGLQSVSFGQIDAFVENLAVAAYYINKEGIPNLRVAGTTDFSFAWSIGVSRKYPLLYSSIQKALDGIPQNDLERIREKWISLKPEYGVDPETLQWLKLAALFVAVLLISLAGSAFLLKRRLNQRVAELRKSEDKFRKLFQKHAAVKLLIGPEDGSIIDANEAAEMFYGWSKEQLRRMRIQDINTLPPEQVKAAMEKAKSQRRVYYEFQHRLADGSIRDVEVFSNAVEVNGKLLLHSIVLDITERKRAEEALRERERVLQSLFSATLTGVALLKDRKVQKVNAGLCRITGYSETELLGQSTRILYPDEDEFSRAGQELYKLLAQEGLGVRETQLQHKDGAIIEALLCVSPFDPEDLAAGACLTVVDITERKRVEADLRQSRAKYLSLFDQSFEGIYLHDLEGRILDVNQMASQQSGYSRSELLQMTVFNLHPSGIDTDQILRQWNQWQPGQRIILETKHQRKDGTEYPVEISTGVILQDDTLLMLAIVRDITQRKRESESLRRTQFAMDRASDSVIWVDEDGKMVYVNDAACASMGYSREELFSMKVFDIDPDFLPEYWEQHKAEMRRLGKMSFESRHRTKDGRIFPVEVRTNYFEFDGHFMACAFDRDITERKRAEAALEKRIMALIQPLDDPEGIAIEDLFNLKDLQRLQDEFAQATGVASLITHPDGTPITQPSNFSHLCAGIIRKTEVGCANCRHSDARVGNSASREGFTIQLCLGAGLWNSGASITVGGRHIANWLIGQVRDETQTEENMRAYARKIGADEAAFMEAFHKVPVMAQEQFKNVAQVLFTLASQLSASAYQNVQQARFITERKRAEEEREKLQGQLAQAQKMESVGRLAGGVAHDFNNMLGVIIGHTELALEQVEQTQPLYVSLVEIRKAAQRSTELTRQLLAFARKQTVTPKVLDLNNTVEGMLNMLQRLIGEDIELAWRPGKDIGLIKMDPSQIDQILANLCVNARDAIMNTGMVAIETDSAAFDEVYCEEHPGFVPGEYVLLAVNDDGCGMDRDTLDKLFEPFFTTKPMGKGTGLGLATVYGIVKQNDGFINVYSEPGHGTTFKIYLPRCATKDALMPKEELARPVAGGQETILLVEDEPGILKMTLKMLERQGYTVLAASTPGGAMSQAAQYKGEIHLLMSDVIMPEMNGRDLAKDLLSIYPDLKLLFMSGYTADVIAHHGVLEEGVHFIQKPFSINDLAAKVREVLDFGGNVKDRLLPE